MEIKLVTRSVLVLKPMAILDKKLLLKFGQLAFEIRGLIFWISLAAEECQFRRLRQRVKVLSLGVDNPDSQHFQSAEQRCPMDPWWWAALGFQ